MVYDRDKMSDPLYPREREKREKRRKKKKKKKKKREEKKKEGKTHEYRDCMIVWFTTGTKCQIHCTQGQSQKGGRGKGEDPQSTCLCRTVGSIRGASHSKMQDPAWAVIIPEKKNKRVQCMHTTTQF